MTVFYKSFRPPRSLLLTFLVLSCFCHPAAASQVFQESAGQVVMEAEDDDAKIPRGGQDWLLQTSQAGFAGTGYLQALPNTGVTRSTVYVGTSPELLYTVQVTTPGTYYVWVRGFGPSGNDDSLHAGLDGTGPASADRMNGFPATWTWSRSTMDGVPATLTITTPGLHTIHLWMREDGFLVDRLLLRTDPSPTPPTGLGPAESARSTPG